jgi:hypothetical protein
MATPFGASVTAPEQVQMVWSRIGATIMNP